MADQAILEAFVEVKADAVQADKAITAASDKLEKGLKKAGEQSGKAVKGAMLEHVATLSRGIAELSDKLSKPLERVLKTGGVGAGLAIAAFLKSGSVEAQKFQVALGNIESATAGVGKKLATEVNVFRGKTLYQWAEILADKLNSLDTAKLQKLVDYGKEFAAVFVGMKGITIGGQLVASGSKLAQDIRKAGLIGGASTAGGDLLGGALGTGYDIGVGHGATHLIGNNARDIYGRLQGGLTAAQYNAQPIIQRASLWGTRAGSIATSIGAGAVAGKAADLAAGASMGLSRMTQAAGAFGAGLLSAIPIIAIAAAVAAAVLAGLKMVIPETKGLGWGEYAGAIGSGIKNKLTYRTGESAFSANFMQEDTFKKGLDNKGLFTSLRMPEMVTDFQRQIARQGDTYAGGTPANIQKSWLGRIDEIRTNNITSMAEVKDKLSQFPDNPKLKEMQKGLEANQDILNGQRKSIAGSIMSENERKYQFGMGQNDFDKRIKKVQEKIDKPEAHPTSISTGIGVTEIGNALAQAINKDQNDQKQREKELLDLQKEIKDLQKEKKDADAEFQRQSLIAQQTVADVLSGKANSCYTVPTP